MRKSIVKLSGVVNDGTKMVADCLRMTNLQYVHHLSKRVLAKYETLYIYNRQNKAELNKEIPWLVATLKKLNLI